MVRDFIAFAEASPTAYQAADRAVERLTREGYTRLAEGEEWEIKDGGKYFVSRNGSSVIAFRADKSARAYRIAASHSDSPMFRLKPVFEEADQHYVKFNTEKYGGTILSTWFDRPLSVAGRVVVRDGEELAVRHVDIARDMFVIPSMPIHFNREVNDGYAFNPQTDTLPLAGSSDAKGGLMRAIAREAGVREEDVLSHELYLYDRVKGFVWGENDEFFSCPRIDDLMCAYTSLIGFLAADKGEDMPVWAMLDNEEVGSTTKQGANSTFLRDVLWRVAAAFGYTDGKTRGMIRGSFMASADNAHALHPNHPEKYDAENRVYMNQGIVIKMNGNQKYTTDAVSEAVFADILTRAGVPHQHFANRSDMVGGGTLGNIANSHVSMDTVDIGLAQLAMHSSYETAGSRDVAYMAKGLAAFYAAAIRLKRV